MAAREGQQQCPAHRRTWQEDTVLSRGAFACTEHKSPGAWPETRRPGPEEVCIGTSVPCSKLACAELPS